MSLETSNIGLDTKASQSGRLRKRQSISRYKKGHGTEFLGSLCSEESWKFSTRSTTHKPLVSPTGKRFLYYDYTCLSLIEKQGDSG